MTRDELKEKIINAIGFAHSEGWGKDDEEIAELKQFVIFALSQEPCEKQIKIGTKVRTTKDKDFACEKVFPVGTIGIVERIDKGDNLPYKIVANNDFFYYSRDMFEIIEDVEPCDDAISREDAIMAIEWGIECTTEEWKKDGRALCAKKIRELPSVTQKSGKWITTRTFMHDGEYYCNRCKCDAPNNEKWNYCPNCGAKMESEDKV